MNAPFSPAVDNVLDALPDHSGQTRRKPVVFFATPPAEIGNLLSAESTFESVSHTWMWPYLGRVMLGVILGGAIILGMNRFARYVEPPTSHDPTIRYCGWGIAIALVAIQLWYGKFTATCSYVGTLGIAKYTAKAGRMAEPKADILFFKQAASLDAREGCPIDHGIPIGHYFKFSWNDRNGQSLFRLAGESRLFVLRDGDSRAFADAAVRAWKGFSAS